MAEYKKKIVVLLAVAASVSGALVVCPAQSIGSEAVKPLFDNPSYVSAKDPNFSTRPADNPGSREMFSKMMASVLLVLVFGTAAIYISKKFLPKITNLSGKNIHIVETVYLSSRKAVHLVEIGGYKIFT